LARLLNLLHYFYAERAAAIDQLDAVAAALWDSSQPVDDTDIAAPSTPSAVAAVTFSAATPQQLGDAQNQIRASP